MKKILTATVAAIMGFSCISLAACGDGAEEITVSFKQKDASEVLNLKKFNLFTSDWTWSGNAPGTFDEDMLTVIPAMNEAKSENLRFAMGMGTGYNGIGHYVGYNGREGLTDSEYMPILKLLDGLKSAEIQPYVSIAYAPDCTLDSGQWKSVPNAEKWRKFNVNLANVLGRHGVNAIYEILNEPDNTQFFNGSWEDYTDTYIAGYRGIKSVHPDAVVAGMSAAWMNKRATVRRAHDIGGAAKTVTDLGYFIERTYDEALADAFSWHYYGQDGACENLGEDSFSYYLNAYREVINGYTATGNYPKLETVQTHLNEFNVYVMGTTEKYMSAEIVPYMFKAMDGILQASDITNMNWAALVGEKTDGLSYEMINGLSYERYPSYYALWMFAHLPVDRVKTEIADKQLISYAGADDGRAGLILCNDSAVSKTVTVKCNDFPFEKANATAYLADDTHKTYSSSNVPYVIARDENLPTKEGISLTVTLEPNATVYFEFNDAAGTKTDLDYQQSLGEYVRSDYWYPERADNTPFSNVNRQSLAGYVGMNGSAAGKSAASVLLKNVEEQQFTVDYEVFASEKSLADAALGIRVDFECEDGSFAQSVLYSPEGYEGNPAIPFGTAEAALYHRSLGKASKGSCAVKLGEFAPGDWTGTVRISWIIKDCAADTAAKFLIKNVKQ